MLIQLKPREWFRRDPNQPRKAYPKDKLEALAASIRARGILQPLGAKPDGTILWGHGRFEAGGLAGVTEYPVVVTAGEVGECEALLTAYTENAVRCDFTDAEVYETVCRLREMRPQWMGVDLARHLHKSPAAVSNILAVDDLVEPVKAAFLANRFGFSAAASLARLAPDKQQDMMNLHLAGELTRDQLQQAAKKPAKPAGNPPKLVIPLNVRTKEVTAVGTVTLAGAGGLDEAETLLKEALKAVREMRGRGCGAKAAMSAWKDMAQKGGVGQ